MTAFKPRMESGTASTVLQTILSGPVSDVHPIEQGEISKVFSFSHQGHEYVIHFNSSGEGFEREQYIYETFSLQGLPIPRIIKQGKADELFYSIAVKVPGKSIASYHVSEVRKILPDLVEQFAKINRVSLGETKGYGWIQPSGDGACESWPEFLAYRFKEEQSGFWSGWHELFTQSFLERDVFEHLYAIMMDLAKYSPEQRYLVHGDFHLGNMLSDGQTVTGIVDWEEAMYGDFVFDLATQHLWTPYLQIPQMVRDAWACLGQDIPYFEERLSCALLFKGVDGLRFYAKKGDRNAYDSVKSQLLSLTNER